MVLDLNRISLEEDDENPSGAVPQQSSSAQRKQSDVKERKDFQLATMLAGTRWLILISIVVLVDVIFT